MRICKSVRTRSDSYRSFWFECELEKKSTVLDPNNCPKGILLKRWWEPRNKTLTSMTDRPKLFAANTITNINNANTNLRVESFGSSGSNSGVAGTLSPSL